MGTSLLFTVYPTFIVALPSVTRNNGPLSIVTEVFCVGRRSEMRMTR